MNKSPTSSGMPTIPIAARCCALSAALALSLAASEARAETPLALDRMAVAKLAATQSPSAVVATYRIAEARALGVGARATPNPEVSAYVGPRWEAGATTDFFVGVAWPLDLSGAPSRRARVAVDRAHAAEAEADVARRSAVAEALDLWVRALGADERARVEDARLKLDRALVSAADARRRAGTTGDGELALARILEAEGIARKASADGEREALLVRIRGRLGLGPAVAVRLAGSLEPDSPPPLQTLIARLPRQPTAARAQANVTAAASNASLQERLGVPIPRVTAGGGRDPRSYVHVGLDLPVPIFQRNQTSTAEATARAATARSEYAQSASLTEAELRAAYVEYSAARVALDALRAVVPQIDDAEHLATRSYELGQSTLTEVVTTQREATAARLAVIDAEVALARARNAVDALAGATP